jgi:hypothetical protein
MKWSCPDLRYDPGMCLEGLRKTMRILSWDIQSLSWDFNPGPPEYKAGVLTTHLQCLIEGVCIEKLVVTQLIKKLPNFYWTWSSLPCSQNPVIKRSLHIQCNFLGHTDQPGLPLKGQNSFLRISPPLNSCSFSAITINAYGVIVFIHDIS